MCMASILHHTCLSTSSILLLVWTELTSTKERPPGRRPTMSTIPQRSQVTEWLHEPTRPDSLHHWIHSSRCQRPVQVPLSLSLLFSYLCFCGWLIQDEESIAVLNLSYDFRFLILRLALWLLDFRALTVCSLLRLGFGRVFIRALLGVIVTLLVKASIFHFSNFKGVGNKW